MCVPKDGTRLVQGEPAITHRMSQALGLKPLNRINCSASIFLSEKRRNRRVSCINMDRVVPTDAPLAHHRRR
jgi:hypothetical protein